MGGLTLTVWRLEVCPDSRFLFEQGILLILEGQVPWRSLVSPECACSPSDPRNKWGLERSAAAASFLKSPF